MKSKSLLLLVCMALVSFTGFAQTNLMSNWAGPDGLGPGAATEYGWDVVTATGEPDGAGLVQWNTANTFPGVRYSDVTPSSNPVHNLDGVPYTGRLLMLRWDAGSEATLGYVFSYPVTLTAGNYNLSFVYEWWDNASAPTYTVGVSRDKAGMDKIATQALTTETRNIMQTAIISFQAPTAGTYYITFQSSTAALGGFGGFNLISTTTTSAAKDLLASNYTIYPNPSNRADGLFIAANSTGNEAAQLFIYNVTGQLQKQIALKAAQDTKVDISDLSAGMYVAKVVTSKGSFNKTLVIQ